MADLAYSLQLLAGLGDQLGGLADAMEGTAARTTWSADDVGHRSVSAALEHFADNWDDRRELLTRNLRAVADMASGSADTFRQVDDGLAEKVADVLEPR